MRYILPVTLLASVTVIPSSAKAWGDHGHQLICQIAYDRVKDTTRMEMDRLLRQSKSPRQKRFSTACNYADAWRAANKEQDKKEKKDVGRGDEHFLNLRQSDFEYTGMGCGLKSKCAVTAIEQDSKTLGDKTKSDKERRRALIFLGHWVGDIHQPLHIAHAGGGNSITDTGVCVSYGSNNLHAVWDKCILRYSLYGDAKNNVPGASELGFFDGVKRLLSRFSASDISSFSSGNPKDWADESFKIAVAPATRYCAGTTGVCRDTKEVKTDVQYLDDNKGVVDKRLVEAGVRLAMLLDATLN
jgi:S1/P1 Nuclease